jgi:hypothetical protein
MHWFDEAVASPCLPPFYGLPIAPAQPDFPIFECWRRLGGSGFSRRSSVIFSDKWRCFFIAN